MPKSAQIIATCEHVIIFMDYVPFFKTHGFSSEAELIQNFKQWFRVKDIIVCYGSDPKKKMKLFAWLMIEDMKLPHWSERVRQSYHQVALSLKKQSIPILNKRYPKVAHVVYASFPVKKQTDAKYAHGHYSL